MPRRTARPIPDAGSDTGPDAPEPFADLAARLRAGEIAALARAITLIESTRPDHRERADGLLEHLLDAPPPATLRIGISGAPGVGK